jgi:ankyrin repeat protein
MQSLNDKLLNDKLFNAVSKGKTGSVEKLLEQGANINSRDKVSKNTVNLQC